jgi:type IV secretion system protein VirB10
MFRLAAAKSILFLLASLVPGISLAQGLLWLDQVPLQQSQPAAGAAETSAGHRNTEETPPQARITIPAGTRVLMELRSPLHTTSGSEGSGLYLQTLHPVIQDNQIVIPAHTQVQGEVEGNQRPGHFRRTAEFKFRFTSLIFPNNHVVTIDGALQSIPGSKTTRSERSDGELRTVDQAEKVIPPAAAGAATGAMLGSVRSTGVGTYVGAGLGAGLGLVTILLKRGDEISLPRGTNIEMVLESPLILEPEQAAFNARYIPPADAHVDARDTVSDSNHDHRERPSRFRPRPSRTLLPWLLR